MAWYYRAGSEQRGPVTERELAGLASEGVVSAETLVWREGMSGWQAYREVLSGETRTPGLGLATVVCAECQQPVPAGQAIRIEGAAICAACKPIAMQKLREGLPVAAGAEAIRRTHIKHEASVRSIGILYLLSGGVVLSVVGIATVVTISASPAEGMFTAMIPLVFLAILGSVQCWVGLGIRRLKKWTRVPIGVLSGIGLLGFPIGTLINAYILYLVFSSKGKTVLSDDYQVVIAATPHVKYKTSLFIWILLGLFLLLIAVAIIAPLLSGAGR